MSELVAIGAYCIGTNQIDLQAANDNGVAVFIPTLTLAPWWNSRLAKPLRGWTRHLPEKNDALHRRVWGEIRERCA